MNAILFFSWSVKSMSSKSGIQVINLFVISILRKLLLSAIGGGMVVVVVVLVVVVVVLVVVVVGIADKIAWF